MNKQYLVMDIGGTFTKYAMMDEESNILSRGKVPTCKDSQDDFVKMIMELCDAHPEMAGIAISSAGVIDIERGFMYNAGSIFCVHDLPLKEILEEKYHVPVAIENDAKSAARAEVWKGALADCKDSAVVILGTGVGGAVIADRKILRGNHLMAGEFSYMMICGEDPDKPATFAAFWAGVTGLITLTSERTGIPVEELSGETIFAMMKAGDKVVEKCIHDYCRRVALVVINVHFVTNPEKIAIGGGISAEPLLMEILQEELLRLEKEYPVPIPRPEIVVCKYRNDANLIGALAALLES